MEIESLRLMAFAMAEFQKTRPHCVQTACLPREKCDVRSEDNASTTIASGELMSEALPTHTPPASPPPSSPWGWEPQDLFGESRDPAWWSLPRLYTGRAEAQRRGGHAQTGQAAELVCLVRALVASVSGGRKKPQRKGDSAGTPLSIGEGLFPVTSLLTVSLEHMVIATPLFR